MSPDDTTRRAFLRACGAAGLASASAGCVELLPPLGQRVRFGRVEIPDGGPPDYRDLVPLQSAVPDEAHRSTYPGLVATPAADGSDVVGGPVGFGRSFVAGLVDYFGVGIEHYDLAAWTGPVIVLEGPVDAGAVGDVVTASGYDPDGAYEGYDRYTREDAPRTVAVADGRIVFGAGKHRDAYVEAVVDAARGRGRRPHELVANGTAGNGSTSGDDEQTDDADWSADPDVVAAYADLTSSVGGRPFLMLGRNDHVRNVAGPDPDVAFSVSGMDYDEDAVYWFAHTRYRPGVDVPEAELRSALQDDQRAFFASGVDLRTDDRDAVVYSSIPHERFREELSGEYPPQVTWGVRETGSGLVLRHEAGDAVDAERLSVVDGATREPLDRQFADEFDVVSRGAELSVPRADSGVAVEWASSADGSMVTLLSTDGA